MSSYTADQQNLLNLADCLMRSEMANNDPSHDVHHVLRVHNTALHIARSLPHDAPINIWLVEMAALLHDINDHKYAASATGTSGLQDIYGKMELAQATNLKRIIENVSWSKEKRKRAEGAWGDWEENCLELHCVQDADRLDAIGAFGILRCAAFSAVSSRPLYTTGEGDTAIAHFHDKLLKVAGSLKTDLGKTLGAKRHQLMLDFLAAVEEEAGSLSQ